MKRFLLALILVACAVPAFAQNASSTQMQLVNSATFTNRLQYLMAQQAAAVLIEAASDAVNADLNARYTATCHTQRYQYAQTVIGNPASSASAASVQISGANFSGGVIVGTVVVVNGLADSSANDTALAKAVTDTWNILAKCVTNP